jgi:hypothetical protein
MTTGTHPGFTDKTRTHAMKLAQQTPHLLKPLLRFSQFSRLT